MKVIELLNRRKCSGRHPETEKLSVVFGLAIVAAVIVLMSKQSRTVEAVAKSRFLIV